MVAAGSNRTTRDAGVVQFLYCGSVQPTVDGLKYNRDLAACDDIGRMCRKVDVCFIVYSIFIIFIFGCKFITKKT